MRDHAAWVPEGEADRHPPSREVFGKRAVIVKEGGGWEWEDVICEMGGFQDNSGVGRRGVGIDVM